MNEDPDKVEKAFNFLLEHFSKDEPFSKEELRGILGYAKEKTFNTYFSKKLVHLLEEAPNDPQMYFVSVVFKRYNRLDIFKKHFSQSTRAKGTYSETVYIHNITYDFFLPFNNESALTSALDDLFYKDRIKSLLARVNINELKKAYLEKENESDKDYLIRLYNWISSSFGGYSIGTVNGRFKGYELKSFEEISELLKSGRNYLIDEKTAIVHFIFYYGSPITRDSVNYSFDQLDAKQTKISINEDVKIERARIRYFFKILFVKTILTLVDGEDEIWMIERIDGKRSRLFIWKNVLK